MDMMNESASVVPIPKSFVDLFEALRGRYELAPIETNPPATIGMRVLLEPFVIGSGIEGVEARNRSDLERPQHIMEALKLGMIRKQSESLLGDLARSS